MANIGIRHDVYYFATGIGNDFIHDLGGNEYSVESRAIVAERENAEQIS